MTRHDPRPVRVLAQAGASCTATQRPGACRRREERGTPSVLGCGLDSRVVSSTRAPLLLERYFDVASYLVGLDINEI